MWILVKDLQNRKGMPTTWSLLSPSGMRINMYLRKKEEAKGEGIHRVNRTYPESLEEGVFIEVYHSLCPLSQCWHGQIGLRDQFCSRQRLDEATNKLALSGSSCQFAKVQVDRFVLNSAESASFIFLCLFLFRPKPFNFWVFTSLSYWARSTQSILGFDCLFLGLNKWISPNIYTNYEIVVFQYYT